MITGKLFNKCWPKLKPFVWPTLIISIVYAISLLTIVRANYNFMDDLGRSVYGYTWSTEFNRHFSTWISQILNVNLTLSDISPIPQLLSAVMLAIASVCIAYVFDGRKLRTPTLIASCFLGLMPFAIGLFIYKFDSIVMSAAILASTLPILWWRPNEKISAGQYIKLILGITVCCLIMWTSYQAASGILPILVIGLTTLNFLRNNCKFIDIARMVLPYLIGYLIAMVIFLLLPAPAYNYRPTDTYSLSQLLPGIVHNIHVMLSTVKYSFNKYWLLLTGVLVMGYLISLVTLKKQTVLRRFVNLALGLLAAGAIFVLSYGAYLILANPPIVTRAFIGLPVAMTVLTVMTATLIQDRRWRPLFTIPMIITLLSFFIFRIALGNGLADQKSYADFYNSQLAAEIARHPEIKQDNKHYLSLENSIDKSPVLRHVANRYPIVNNITIESIELTQYNYWGYQSIRLNYGAGLLSAHEKKIKCTNKLFTGHYFDLSADNEGNACATIHYYDTPIRH